MRDKIVYIAHPVSGNVEGNLARIRGIVRRINTSPQYADYLPFVPYYADVLSLNDNDPAERKTGLNNALHMLTVPGLVSELWVFGDRISEGVKGEIWAAFGAGIPVVPQESRLTEAINQLAEQWEKR